MNERAKGVEIMQKRKEEEGNIGKGFENTSGNDTTCVIKSERSRCGNNQTELYMPVIKQEVGGGRGA